MNKIETITLLPIITILIFILVTAQVNAQTLTWEIQEEYYEITINKDGTINLNLHLKTLVTQGQIKRYINVGLPSPSIEEINVKTDHGVKKYEVSKSGEWSGVTIYIEKPVKQREILTAEISAKIDHMIYSDELNPGNVGMLFTAAWWESPPAKIRDLRIKVILPEGVDISEVKTTEELWMNYGTENGRTWIYWEKKDLGEKERYTVGVSFPEQYMEKYVKPEEKTISDTIGMLIGAFLVFSVPLIIFVSIAFVLLSVKGITKKRYINPKYQIECMGTRKDLDPVEAAVLLRTHPGKILTMILLSLALKAAIKVKRYKPLQLEKTKPFRKLKLYEERFLDCVQRSGELDEECLIQLLGYIRRRVDRKIQYFCRKDTEEYYKKLVEEKWKRIQKTVLAQQAFQQFNKDLLWLIIDEKYKEKTRETLETKEETEVPETYIYYFPIPRPLPPPGEAKIPRPPLKPTETKPPTQKPTLTTPIEEIANKIATNIETTANNIVTNIEKAANQLITPHRQTQKTSSISRRSCVCACVSCACACACVSCACACAGGGAG